MPRAVDLSNREFGFWRVLAATDQRSSSGSVMWLCECRCGVKRPVSSNTLLRGTSTSCGRCGKVNITNSYRVDKSGGVIVTCSNELSFKIDSSDLNVVKQYQWWIDTKGYVKTKLHNRSISLHRMLLDVSDRGREIFVDHISGDTLDNRRNNLRICAPDENIKNRKLNVTNTTGYKGVSYHRKTKKYMAGISAGTGKTIYLGLHHTAREAALAYDRAAVLYHGEFARTNMQLGLL
jgi:hypothetical protein